MQITQHEQDPGFIDLGIGQPDPSLLPVDIMRKALHSRSGHMDPSPLAYGAEMGSDPFRLSLSRFLSHQYGADEPIPAQEIMVTAGATGALDLIAGTFSRPGDTILVEEPTYFLAHAIFRDRHLNVVGIPTDHGGIVIQALKEHLAHTRPTFVYTIPSFNNPRGTTMSAARRREMIRLSKEHDFLIVADEVYQLLAYETVPPPPMPLLDKSDNVLGIGSFSKILAPGLRLGWIQAAPELLARMGKCGVIQSGGGINPFTTDLIQTLIASGEQGRYLEELKGRYGRRARHLTALLETHLPAETDFLKPKGGYFIWVRIPGKMDAIKLQSRAKRLGVGYRPGIDFSAHKGLNNYIRLCFAFHSRSQLEKGIHRLVQALQE
jgi:DNA-binding transcriptional MocR family regulator